LPPMTLLADVQAISHLVDAFILVIEFGRTSQQAVIDALNAAQPVCEKLLGAVLNRANPNELKRLAAWSAATAPAAGLGACRARADFDGGCGSVVRKRTCADLRSAGRIRDGRANPIVSDLHYAAGLGRDLGVSTRSHMAPTRVLCDVPAAGHMVS